MAEAATCQPLRVEFVLDEVALGQEFRLVQSVLRASFHQCSVLIRNSTSTDGLQS